MSKHIEHFTNAERALMPEYVERLRAAIKSVEALQDDRFDSITSGQMMHRNQKLLEEIQAYLKSAPFEAEYHHKESHKSTASCNEPGCTDCAGEETDQ